MFQGSLTVWDITSGMPVRIVRLGDRDDSVFIRHLMPVADTIVCDYGNQLRVVKLPVAEKLEWFNWFSMRTLTSVFSGQVHCYGNWNTTWEALYLSEYFLHVRFGCPWLSLSLTSVHCCTSVVLPVISHLRSCLPKTSNHQEVWNAVDGRK